jgi:hypothetical protein
VTASLDDLYLSWLYSQVGDVRVRNKSRTYWDLFTQMYNKPFVWFVPNDDNRVMDGLDLRYEWMGSRPESEWDIAPDRDWLERECSFLELMVALSRRLAFEGGGHPPVWFWHLIENLGLKECTDRPRYDQGEVEKRLDNVIWRTYEPNGRGGLFPMRHSRFDQREIEIWYQMNEYLLDA